MRADDDIASCGHRLDRLADEGTQLVASRRERLSGERRRKSADDCHSGGAGRAELIEHPPQQRFPLLGVRDQFRRRAGSLSGGRNNLLVDVAESQLVRHKPRHVVATRTVAVGDADERPSHAVDVTPRPERSSTAPAIALRSDLWIAILASDST